MYKQCRTKNQNIIHVALYHAYFHSLLTSHTYVYILFTDSCILVGRRKISSTNFIHTHTRHIDFHGVYTRIWIVIIVYQSVINIKCYQTFDYTTHATAVLNRGGGWSNLRQGALPSHRCNLLLVVQINSAVAAARSKTKQPQHPLLFRVLTPLCAVFPFLFLFLFRMKR